VIFLHIIFLHIIFLHIIFFGICLNMLAHDHSPGSASNANLYNFLISLGVTGVTKNRQSRAMICLLC
jgi:hypothetical protein